MPFSISRPARMSGSACSAMTASSVVSAGVRIAQFRSKSNVELASRARLAFRRISTSAYPCINIIRQVTHITAMHGTDRAAQFHGHRAVALLECIGAIRRQCAGRRTDARLGRECGASVRPAESARRIINDHGIYQRLYAQLHSAHVSRDATHPPHPTTTHRSHALAQRHRAQCRRLCRALVSHTTMPSQPRLSRRLLLRRDGWRHRRAQKSTTAASTAPTPASASGWAIRRSTSAIAGNRLALGEGVCVRAPSICECCGRLACRALSRASAHLRFAAPQKIARRASPEHSRFALACLSPVWT